MAKVRKELEGSVIAVNEAEQYKHLLAGQKIPDGYFVGGHAVEDGDPSDQTPPWKAEPATGNSAPAEGELEQLVSSGLTPDEVLAEVAKRLGVQVPTAPSQAAPSDGDSGNSTGEPAAKPDAQESVTIPPLNGAGSGKDAWRDYATKATEAAGLSIEIPEDATRGDIVDALKSAGIRTE